ncbi:MAG: methylenetetrahydrofolate reductase C-terminal domain-containing protein [Thermoplasmatales archaeon]|nr:methylenetetrahydrofolate reductase C-terminal domain-containing protein [Thermoplasmatales archaeon]
MIITKQKDIDDLLNALRDGPIFIAGCSKCATLCHTGGEKEVLAMKEVLEKKNLKISGWVVLDPACHLQNDKKLLRSHKKELEESKVVLALSCGNGIQTLSEILDIRIVAGTDTLFLGEIKHVNEFEERCVMCGECIADLFGFCPIARCPKSMLNGPCEGVKNGKCEVDPGMDCVWHLIYEHLKETGHPEVLEVIQPPKDWSVSAGRGNKWKI